MICYCFIVCKRAVWTFFRISHIVFHLRKKSKGLGVNYPFKCWHDLRTCVLKATVYAMTSCPVLKPMRHSICWNQWMPNSAWHTARVNKRVIPHLNALAELDTAINTTLHQSVTVLKVHNWTDMWSIIQRNTAEGHTAAYLRQDATRRVSSLLTQPLSPTLLAAVHRVTFISD